jgi:hypothetical protein
MADLATSAVKNLLDSPKDNDEYWKKQGESHGHRGTREVVTNAKKHSRQVYEGGYSCV